MIANLRGVSVVVNRCGKISHVCYDGIIKLVRTVMTQEAVSNHLIRALRRVMSPLVKLMLTKGLTYPQFMELMKSVFVDVADQEFQLEGKAQTDSRISLLTGVHRKDVKRLRETPATEQSVANKATPLGAQVIARWLADQRFCDQVGQPRPLQRIRAEHSTQGSFDDLVSGITQDIRPRALLDEWLRLGVVSLDDHDVVHLQLAAFVPQSDMDDKLFYFGLNLHDHLAAATHNICQTSQKPFFERSVHYTHLPASLIPQLAKQAETLGMQMLIELNHQAANAFDQTVEPVETQRFTCGIYFYNDDDDQAPNTDAIAPENHHE